VLQCVAVCCSVLQCAAVCCSVLQCAAVCCSVLQCAAVCCSAMQCVAACCSVLQCVSLFETDSLYCTVQALAQSVQEINKSINKSICIWRNQYAISVYCILIYFFIPSFVYLFIYLFICLFNTLAYSRGNYSFGQSVKINKQIHAYVLDWCVTCYIVNMHVT